MSKRFMDLLNEIDSSTLTSGRALRAFRKGRNLTLKDVEDVTGIKEQNLSALENDRLEMSVYYAEILAAVLGLHPTDILFPNGQWAKSKQILQIEKRSLELIRRKEKAV